MNPAADLPIGVFDSGLGGLTIVKALRNLLPAERIIYFGDTAHLPYGDKSPQLISEYSAAIARFLIGQQVKAIVIACNTASAVALADVKKEAGRKLPVFDVIRPAVRAALSQGRYVSDIGVIGTKTTINSKVYWMTIREEARNARIVQKATPLLVPMIEEGWFNDDISREVIEAYLSDTGFSSINTLILGCTHYPLIKDQVQQFFKENFDHEVTVIDSSIAVAETVRAELGRLGLLSGRSSPPEHKFCVSDFTQNFEDSARLFLGESVKFEKVSL